MNWARTFGNLAAMDTAVEEDRIRYNAAAVTRQQQPRPQQQIPIIIINKPQTLDSEPASLTLWRETKRQRIQAEEVNRQQQQQQQHKEEEERRNQQQAQERAASAAAAAAPPPPQNTYFTRQAHLSSLPVEQFEKSHSKHFSRAKLFITQLTNTRTDVMDKITAPKHLFQQVFEKAGRDKLELAMQAIANRIVLVASSSLSIEKITRGDHHFALCYMTLLLCDKHTALEGDMFRDCMLAALERACPYITPSAVQAILADSSTRNKREQLGYLSVQETDDEYLMRMQSIIGFYSCLLQCTGDMLVKENRLLEEEEQWENPFGGIQQAWRWLAATLNAPILRWTRFLIQAFFVIAGHELSRVCIHTNQVAKLLRLLESPKFLATPPPSQEDADRNTSFQTFVRDSLKQATQGDGMLRAPGRKEDDQWVDCRVLPQRAITNVG